MAFFHGIRSTETPTSILPAATCEAAMPVYFGSAPVHRTGGKVNVPILAIGYDDAVMELGYDADWEKWTLCEDIYAQFALFAMSPCVFVNVFDPEKHRTQVDGEAMELNDKGVGTTEIKDVILSSIVLKATGGSTTFEAGKDYSAAYDADYHATILRKASGSIPEGAQLEISYAYADPGKVTRDDIIGGINPTTGIEEGLEAIERVFPLFRKRPGTIVATGWSQDPVVSAVMTAKSQGINGIFGAVALTDIPVDGEDAPTKYTEVPSWKERNNYVDKMQHNTWPMIALGDLEFRFSSQLAALTQWTTHYSGKGIPYVSPSNHNLKATGLVVGPKGARIEVNLTLLKANYLNENGITTALNWIDGWKNWGNRQGCFPANTDTKDVFLPGRLMFNWIEAEFILTFWQKVDRPITRRLVETIVDSFNDRLNGLAAQESILGGRIEFRKQDNPVTDLMNAKMKFKTYLTPPPPAEEIVNDFELDPAYFEILFAR